MEGLKVRWDKGGEGRGKYCFKWWLFKLVKCKINDIWNILGYIIEEVNVYGNVKIKWCIFGKVEELLKMDLVKEFWLNVKLLFLILFNFVFLYICFKDESVKVWGVIMEYYKLIKVYEEKIVFCK